MRSEIEDLREDEASFDLIIEILEARRKVIEKQAAITAERNRMLDEAEDDFRAGRVLTSEEMWASMQSWRNQE